MRIMDKSPVLLLFAATGWFILGCTNTEFGGNSPLIRDRAKTSEGGRHLTLPGNSYIDPQKPGKMPPGRNTDLQGGQFCVHQIPPVHVAMVIDRSGSMEDKLHAVRDGLSSFTNKLSSTPIPGFNLPIKDLNYSFIAYEDEESRSDCPWFTGGPWPANSLQILSTLQSEFERDNSCWSDGVEGGILAIRKAMEIFEQQPPDSVKVIVLVTDAYMHDGSGTDGNRFGGFGTLDGLLVSPKMKPFMLFSAAAGRESNGRGDFDDQTDRTYPGGGAQQIQALRDYYKRKVGAPNAYVGEAFANVRQFNGSAVLANSVAAKIANGIKKCP